MSVAISEPQKSDLPRSLRSRVGIAAPLPGPPGPGVVVPRRRARPDRPGRGRLPAGATLECACGRSRRLAVVITGGALGPGHLAPAVVDQAADRRRDRESVSLSLASESEPSSSMPGFPAELIDSEGVTPSLVGALEEETEIQAQPLPLDRVVPWRRVWAVASDGGGARARTLGRRRRSIPSGGSRLSAPC